MTIQEAGFDGFWLHRLLEANGIESHVVDAASVAVNRRQRRAKTDRIDLDMLLRTLAAFRRGERRACPMVHPPLPADEDRRRAGRERQRLITEKTQHLNRIKGLLATQGNGQSHRRAVTAAPDLSSCAWVTDVLPARLKQEILRELERLERSCWPSSRRLRRSGRGS